MRVVTKPDGSVWREWDLDSGRIRRERISGRSLVRGYAGADAARIAHGGYRRPEPAYRRVEPAEEQRETPELRLDAAPKIEIVVPSSAYRTMTSDTFWGTRQDDLEVGGFCFVAETPRSWHKTIRIFQATDTADGVRRANSLELDAAEWVRVEELLKKQGWHDVEMAGFWHSHPVGGGIPSDADTRAALSVLDWSAEHGRHAAFSIALIFHPGERGWAHQLSGWATPRVDGWVVRRTRISSVCEPAHVRRLR